MANKEVKDGKTPSQKEVKTSAEITTEWAKKEFPPGDPSLATATLGKLEPGARFQIPGTGKKGTLLYATTSRARIKYDREFVDVNSDYPVDIASDIKVIPLA